MFFVPPTSYVLSVSVDNTQDHGKDMNIKKYIEHKNSLFHFVYHTFDFLLIIQSNVKLHFRHCWEQ